MCQESFWGHACIYSVRFSCFATSRLPMTVSQQLQMLVGPFYEPSYLHSAQTRTVCVDQCRCSIGRVNLDMLSFCKHVCSHADSATNESYLFTHTHTRQFINCMHALTLLYEYIYIYESLIHIAQRGRRQPGEIRQ